MGLGDSNSSWMWGQQGQSSSRPLSSAPNRSGRGEQLAGHSPEGGTVPSGSLGLGVAATGPPDRGDSPRNAQRGFGAVPWDPHRLWEGFGGSRNHPAMPPRSSHPLAAVAELSLPK